MVRTGLLVVFRLAVLSVAVALLFPSGAAAQEPTAPTPPLTCDGQAVETHVQAAAKVIKKAYAHKRWQQKRPYKQSHRNRVEQHILCILDLAEQKQARKQLENYRAEKAHSFRKHRRWQILIHQSRFSKSDLVRLWKGVNGKAGNPRLMAAISLAEGTCIGVTPPRACIRAHGPPDGRGLWQIEWPLWRGRLSHLGNPYKAVPNAKMALAVLRAQGLRAWVAYTNGRYRRYCPC